MAEELDRKISQLPQKERVEGTERIPVASGGDNYHLTPAQLKEYAKPDLSEYMKTEDAQKAFQPKGNYQPAGDYVTEEDLESKGYATKEELDNLNIEDLVMYGIERDKTVSSSDCMRIGNQNLHRTLPVHSLMRGCLLDDDGNVTKYLNPGDWTGETRDGSQGQVMVEVPDHYMRFETDGNIQRVKLSTVPIAGYKHIKKYYVSAYEASIQRSTTTLCSVVNTDADYRGGNNTSSWDGTYRSLLGLPATQINRTNFRNYARKRKEGSTEWNCMTYDIQKDLYWLFVIEYATLNSQKPFDATKDANGYAQGGLGNGVTTVNGTKWNSFNGYNPLIPCGHSDELGNGTGQVDFTMRVEYEANGAANYMGEYNAETAYTDGQYVSQGEDLYECLADAPAGTTPTNTSYFAKRALSVVKVCRYRGIENPFGHLWKWTDGINVRISPTVENGGDGLSKVFVSDNPEYFNDTNYDGYQYVGDEARTESYVKEVIFGEGGEIMPLVVGAGSTTYFCDYHYTNIPTTDNLRGVLFGGSALIGAYAGFVYACSHSAPSHALAYFGSRLCFIPA